jgi:hypothetical protein
MIGLAVCTFLYVYTYIHSSCVFPFSASLLSVLSKPKKLCIFGLPAQHFTLDLRPFIDISHLDTPNPASFLIIQLCTSSDYISVLCWLTGMQIYLLPSGESLFSPDNSSLWTPLTLNLKRVCWFWRCWNTHFDQDILFYQDRNFLMLFGLRKIDLTTSWQAVRLTFLRASHQCQTVKVNDTRFCPFLHRSAKFHFSGFKWEDTNSNDNLTSRKIYCAVDFISLICRHNHIFNFEPENCTKNCSYHSLVILEIYSPNHSYSNFCTGEC